MTALCPDVHAPARARRRRRRRRRGRRARRPQREPGVRVAGRRRASSPVVRGRSRASRRTSGAASARRAVARRSRPARPAFASSSARRRFRSWTWPPVAVQTTRRPAEPTANASFQATSSRRSAGSTAPPGHPPRSWAPSSVPSGSAERRTVTASRRRGRGRGIRTSSSPSSPLSRGETLRTRLSGIGGKARATTRASGGGGNGALPSTRNPRPQPLSVLQHPFLGSVGGRLRARVTRLSA